MSAAPDVARIRFENAMRLFDEFVQATVKSPDAATLRGLERRFAERLQIQPSYWSQIKGRSRQIGERLARQFEQLCRKPVGWLDLDRGVQTQGSAVWQLGSLAGGGPSRPVEVVVPPPSAPQDDDERFMVGLVLTYYRRHPQQARSRLLQLLGEVLEPDLHLRVADEGTRQGRAAQRPGVRRERNIAPSRQEMGAPASDDQALWQRLQAGIAPLKPRK